MAIQLPDDVQFDTARLIGNFVNGSPEWHEHRKGAVGGSQVGAIIGCSPYESQVTAFYKATGQIPDSIEPNMSMKIGTMLETPILNLFENEHPELEVFTTGTYEHVEHTWAHANPDGLFRDADGNWGIVEIKFARDYWSDGLPLHYRKQVMWYMHLLGLKRAVVVALAGSSYTEIWVDYDLFEAEAMMAEVQRFRACVESATQPDWDGSASTLETVRRLHPDIDPELSVELGDLGMHLVNAYTDLKAAERHYNELQSRTLDAMGKAKSGTVDDRVVVTRQARGVNAPYLVIKK